MGWLSNDTPDESETDKGLNDLSARDLDKLLKALGKDPKEKNSEGKKPDKKGWFG